MLNAAEITDVQSKKFTEIIDGFLGEIQEKLLKLPGTATKVDFLIHRRYSPRLVEELTKLGYTVDILTVEDNLDEENRHCGPIDHYEHRLIIRWANKK